MKIFKNILCLALVLVMCCTVFVGCSDQKEESKVDLDGYEFTIASPWLVNDTAGATLATYERAFQKRRQEVEREFNCKITIIKPENIMQQMLAGEKVADWINQTTYNVMNYAASDYLIPYEDIKGIDIKSDKWIKSYSDLFAMDGKHYAINFLKPASARNILLVNKTMLKENGVEEDIYQLVRDNKWTFDKFREIAQKCTNVQKGTYGVMFYDVYEAFASFIAANGAKIADIKGGAVKEYTTSKEVLNALNFVDSICNEYKVVKIDDKQRSGPTFATYTVSQAQIAQQFLNNKIAFYMMDMWVANQLIKPLEPEIEYGMVPVPMGPDTDKYHSSSFGADAFCVTKNNKDLDKAVVIMNALAEPAEGYEGDEWVEDAVINDYFQEGDTGSFDMYKICIENMTYDFMRTSGTNDLYGEFVVNCGLNPIFFRKSSVSSALQSFNGVPTNRLNELFGFESKK